VITGRKDGAALAAPSSRPGPLLEVDNLRIAIPTEAGVIEAVRGVSVSLSARDTIGVVGESGSGKTMLALAILGLLPESAQVSGSIRLDGKELLECRPAEWQAIRGARVAMVFQDPLTALNPMYTVGWQVAEGLRLHGRQHGWQHGRADRQGAWKRAVELLDLVGLPEPAQLARRYPHELSGGMRQRVVIAIAIANQPELIIADEPTTALDVTVQAQILDTLRTIRRETGAAMMLISHDLGVVADVAERVLVMYAGRAVEIGRAEDVFRDPRMPYTAGLLASLPVLDRRQGRLPSIPGVPPTGIGYGDGCPFVPRCPLAAGACAAEPALLSIGPGHQAACHFAAGDLPGDPPGDLPGDGPAEGMAGERAGAGGGPPAARPGRMRLAWSAPAPAPAPDGGPAGPDAAGPGAAGADAAGPGAAGAGGAGRPDAVLTVRGLVKNFRVRGPGFRGSVTLQAVSGVDLDLHPGRCLALVGESGCGKSTLARLLLRLDQPTAGSIVLAGHDLTSLNEKLLRPLRQDMQMVFQDPYSSLNPRLSVGEIIGEPLIVHKIRDRAARVRELLATVGLDPAAAVRFPGEFSGGQRQRIGIARALALEPRVLILDEPVSALDVSIQASILNLLRDLQHQRGLAYLFISHDLAVVRQVADEIAVMHLGTIVERGSAESIYQRPAHPYTVALLSAVPVPDPASERTRERILLRGEVPSAVNPPSGCRFRTRCWKAQPRCAEEVPQPRLVAVDHWVDCHYPENVPGSPAPGDQQSAASRP
jgi:peptide/nickel transport system ATP-binding protein